MEPNTTRFILGAHVGSVRLLDIQIHVYIL
jgi:hypothetical protein